MYDTDTITPEILEELASAWNELDTWREEVDDDIAP